MGDNSMLATAKVEGLSFPYYCDISVDNLVSPPPYLNNIIKFIYYDRENTLAPHYKD
jgi:hypothetical protein